ncbi:MAG: Hsp20/alpha crystallin family protein [Phycisphaeraceae bacterium]
MLPTRRTDNPFALLQNEIDRAFDRVWGMGNGGSAPATAAYPVDIRETENDVVVEAELPGFKKEEIDVRLEQGVLTIQAQREQQEQEGESHLSERRFARVARSFRIPVPVDENNVDASLEGGVLTLRLPKREEVRPRRIEVK